MTAGDLSWTAERVPEVGHAAGDAQAGPAPIDRASAPTIAPGRAARRAFGVPLDPIPVTDSFDKATRPVSNERSGRPTGVPGIAFNRYPGRTEPP